MICNYEFCYHGKSGSKLKRDLKYLYYKLVLVYDVKASKTRDIVVYIAEFFGGQALDMVYWMF